MSARLVLNNFTGLPVKWLTGLLVYWFTGFSGFSSFSGFSGLTVFPIYRFALNTIRTSDIFIFIALHVRILGFLATFHSNSNPWKKILTPTKLDVFSNGESVHREIKSNLNISWIDWFFMRAFVKDLAEVPKTFTWLFLLTKVIYYSLIKYRFLSIK